MAVRACKVDGNGLHLCTNSFFINIGDTRDRRDRIAATAQVRHVELVK